jgi:hypothetical protein
MTATDQGKLLDAGFTIIRKQIAPLPLAIKAKINERREWFILQKDFKSVAELERRMKELLKISTCIED